MPALFDDRSRQYLVNALRSKVPQWLEDAAAGVDDARKYVSGLMSENYGKARTAAEVASMIPTPIGDAASAALALDDLRKGDYGSAALNSLGLLPLVPSLAGVTRPYKNVPDSLMGFSSNPIRQKGYGEHAYPHTTPVRVVWSDGEELLDEIAGMNTEHAVERAWRNWPDAIEIMAVK
jgi:hypothetical protein